MFYVYAIQSQKDLSLYIGFSSDLRKRFIEHNRGKVRSTKSKTPYNLIYYEAYKNKTDARKRELEIKASGQQKEILFKRLENSLVQK
ncbi:MAG: GIY-YIG nuclease family protein [Candidatus Portnoybacteria bacterium]|nr:GIY-YIG nuclease family protein [Candidatus Portnoybacteria bacterium]